MMQQLYGRKEEITQIENLLQKQSAELLLLTGRRRVGKSFLITQTLKHKFHFDFTGTYNGSIENQLAKFDTKLQEYKKHKQQLPSNTWKDGFANLKTHLISYTKSNKKKIVFFDEFPWIDQHNSRFFAEFSYWWNDWACKQNILVIITGSATTWMVKRIINNKGGMHNRVTERMHLSPFTLAETKQMVKAINPRLTDYDIIQLYMCMGGIPLYLSKIQKGETAAQSIYNICFKKNGLLNQEFNDLYASLFENHEKHIAVITALHKKWIGLTRAEIAIATGLSDGGGLTRILEDLVASNFVIEIAPLLNIKKGTLFRLADEYSYFYLSFIKNKKISNSSNWLTYQTTVKQYKVWQGYAFENLCIKHAKAICKELGISGITTSICSFYNKVNKDEKGFQIDLLIDRADNAISICEIKFYNKAFPVTNKVIETMREKRGLFIEKSKIRKTVFNTLITTYGIDINSILSSEIDNHLDANCLFSLPRF